MRIFLDADLTRIDDDGVKRPAVDFDENIYYALPKSFGDDKNGIHEFSPQLRTASFIESLQENLNMLSINCGLGSGFYTLKNVGSALTATAIYAGNQDLYRSTKKHEKALKRVIMDILRAVNSSPFTKVSLDMTSLSVVFDDSVIENKDAEKQTDIIDVNSGLMSRVEYRMKWFGESEEDATSAIKLIDSEKMKVLE